MRNIFTDRTLKPDDTIVVYAPGAKRGEEARIIKKDSLLPFVIGDCVGGIRKLLTPSKHGNTANVYKNYRKFKVKE